MSGIGYGNRVALLQAELRRHSLGALLVSDETNVSYLSGFTGHDSMLLVTLKKAFFITDSRYIEEAAQTVKGFDVLLVGVSTYSTIEELVKKNRLKTVGFESMDLPFEVASRLDSMAGPARFKPVKDVVEMQRSVKDSAEIALIKSSIRLTRKVFDKVAALVRPGVSERSLAKKIQMEFIEAGASAAFDPIVASGPNASRPHARPSDTSVKNNSFVMIDIGARLDGYCSDFTRMIILGRAKDKFKKIYEVVRVAQQKAIEMIAPGVAASDIDRAARGYIEDRGFGKYFGHSLGHGVGMGIHEPPAVSRTNRSALKSGMVMTIEPAIYIPGFGGVRTEDMVLVTDRGCEVLTR